MIRKFRIFLPILAISLALHSCSDDFQPNLATDPVPVVYGIINPNDSLYSVRLTKSFLGPGSALYYAKNPDSIYYTGAKVFLETRTLSGNLVERIELEEKTIERRDNGLFARAPNRIYQIDFPRFQIRQEHFDSLGIPYALNLHLVAEIPGLEHPVTSKTRLRTAPRITEPRLIFMKVYFYGEQTFWMQWSDTNPEGIFEILVRMQYTDFLQYEEREMTAEWVLNGINVNQSTFPGASRTIYSYYFRPENFYSQIRAVISKDSLVQARVAGKVDFIILSTNREIEDYRKIYEISDDYHGGGYTNIENGIGLFTTFTSTKKI